MTTKQILHWAQVAVGVAFIVVGFLQTNAGLFGEKYSGLVLSFSGVAMTVLIFLRTQVGDAPPGE